MLDADRIDELNHKYRDNFHSVELVILKGLDLPEPMRHLKFSVEAWVPMAAKVCTDNLQMEFFDIRDCTEYPHIERVSDADLTDEESLAMREVVLTELGRLNKL